MRSSIPVRLKAEELSALVRIAQREGGRSVDVVLRTIRSPLVAYFSRRLPTEDAEDLAQLALVRVVRALPRIDADRAGSFVATIARNLLRTAQRRIGREGRRFASSAVIDDIESSIRVDEETEHHELVAAVRRVSLRSMPRELREVVLALLSGQSYAAIAMQQGVREVTVRTRLVRARAILREELRAYRSEAGPPRAAPGHAHHGNGPTRQNEVADPEVWSCTGRHHRHHRGQG